MANFGAAARTWKGWLESHVYGQVARPDNQGNSGFYTRYSLAKGATDACDHLGIDVDQEVVAVTLVNIHKDFEGKNPAAFHGAELVIPGTELIIPGTNEPKKWYKMTISVEEIDLEYFKLTWDKKCGTFLLGTSKWPGGADCLYAVEWRPIEGKVKCLNSWGKGQDNKEEPLINPVTEISGMWRVSIRLEDEETKKIEQTPLPLQDYPQSFTLQGNAAFWRLLFVGGNPWSHYLGLYRRMNLTKNGRPVWKLETGAHYHLEHVLSNQYFFYSGDKHWMFSDDYNHWMFGRDYTWHSGAIKSVSSGLLSIPSTGWEYGRGLGGVFGGVWKEDLSLRVTIE